ncbi:cytochrome c oxidase subunit 2A [Halalkalibacterium halodurans]|nr:cytochrome c oxidase subunit 2A [Halalkalibacterium halodurans]MED4163843.1 cytochrome c oxidase subunit 2A [Halalkalibacterium halodurans]
MKKTDQEPHHTHLKGTLVSVFILGLLICIAWFGMYLFYVTR